MLTTHNLSQTDQAAATIDRSMLVAAYRYQVQTIRDRLAALPESGHEHLCCARDLLDESEAYLSLYLDTLTGQLAA
ncbi:MAG: hypothetical protein F6K00_27030 [Leptolyngbya sp. SIOISBB]|nr:hypothetical protein [Leptolyngbya sp. SIOISBB]